ncbi:MAG: NUDIX hydrolase [Dehalococcoidia bacterium]
MVSEKAIAAGGVVYRNTNVSLEIVLVSRNEDDLWALPKGRPENGETITQTAIREVKEETGLEVEIIEYIGDVRYTFTNSRRRKIHKVVEYFLMTPTGGSFDQHDEEFDEVNWYDIHHASKILTHKNQIHIIDKAVQIIHSLD